MRPDAPVARLVRVEPRLRGALHLALLRAGMAALRLLPVARPARAAWVLGRLLGRRPVATFAVFGERRLDVPLDDGYWISRLLLDGDYEPEVGYVLSRVLRPTDAFIDCGANIGWWSLFASTVISDASRIVAVEPARSMFERLAAAARQNGDAFAPIHAAVWDRAGIPLTLIADRDRHAAASIEVSGRGERRIGYPEPVTSTTIDELVARSDAAVAGSTDGPGRSVVKLDVEGAEPEALAAAGRLEERDALLVYEDHGRDRASRNTATVLAHGWNVFWYDSAGGMREIVDVTELAARKLDRDRGYNLFACRPNTPVHALLAAWPRAGERPASDDETGG